MGAFRDLQERLLAHGRHGHFHVDMKRTDEDEWKWNYSLYRDDMQTLVARGNGRSGEEAMRRALDQLESAHGS